MKNMYRTPYIIHEIWATIVQLFAFVVLYLTPIANYVHIVLILIAIDLVTGSYASIKEGQKFEARKLRNTVEKFVFYALAIITAYMLQRIISEGAELPRIVALYIGSIEVKSIYENISRITKTDIAVALWDTIKTKIDSILTSYKTKNTQTDDKA
jgi:phage-related holin